MHEESAKIGIWLERGQAGSEVDTGVLHLPLSPAK